MTTLALEAPVGSVAPTVERELPLPPAWATDAPDVGDGSVDYFAQITVPGDSSVIVGKVGDEYVETPLVVEVGRSDSDVEGVGETLVWLGPVQVGELLDERVGVIPIELDERGVWELLRILTDVAATLTR